MGLHRRVGGEKEREGREKREIEGEIGEGRKEREVEQLK